MGKRHQYNINNQVNTPENKSIFKQANRLSIYDINKFQIAKFIYQVLNKLSPSSFYPMFSLVSSIHSYNTRAEETQKLFLKHTKTNIRKFAISVRGPQVWNELPEHIKTPSTIDLFHIKLKKYLIDLTN